MESLAADARYFVQHTPVEGLSYGVEESKDFNTHVMEVASTLLGSDFEFNAPTILDDAELTGLPVYDALTKLLPARSSQSTFYWRKFAKPFASMLVTADFPVPVQIRYLTFVYSRLIGMMGPLQSNGPESLMTYDGSPVELSWIIPSHKKMATGNANRQLRFAIEPIDPRNGKLLSGAAVMKYLTSTAGRFGIVDCEEAAMEWSTATRDMLLPDGTGDYEEDGSRFFVGFDFAPSGSIMLKTYYLPSPRQPLMPVKANQGSSIQLWDANYVPLRDALKELDPSLQKPMDSMIHFVNSLEDRHKPKLQILSADVVRNEKNRLKLYCRPAEGCSWQDAKRSFTLNGRLNAPEMRPAMLRLEALWNALFPYAHSRSGKSLTDCPKFEDPAASQSESRRSVEHPTTGLLYYYCLTPGSQTIMPKIYLPVSRYCPNDKFVADALEKFYSFGETPSTRRPKGWVAEEISRAYDHRDLSSRSGIHTYVTFALKKNYQWEVTTYFSPEVWESS